MMFAAIGTDGTREVVWGLGETEREARAEACEYLNDIHHRAEAVSLRIERITDEQAGIVESGDVSWPVV